MNLIKANIWSYHPEHWIVIPTNIGWKKNGENVMGRGLAAQAKERFPGLASWYGGACRFAVMEDEQIPFRLYYPGHLIMFPVKPLARDPSMSWRQSASLPLIEESAAELRDAILLLALKGVAMPMVGCGNGGLRREDVMPILEKHLGDLPGLTLVDLG